MEEKIQSIIDSLDVNSAYNNKISDSGFAYTSIELEGIENLVCYRTLPFLFNLASTSNAILSRDVRVFYDVELSREGCKKIITAIRDFAVNTVEQWTQSQFKAVAGTKTLYIVYKGYNNCYLKFSEKVLTKVQIQESENTNNVWVSYDISDLGLINLVNELLNWL